METGSDATCSESDRGRLPSTGFLSTFTARERGVGTQSCPWRLRAQPGQTINLTLYDFNTRQGSQYTGWPSGFIPLGHYATGVSSSLLVPQGLVTVTMAVVCSFVCKVTTKRIFPHFSKARKTMVTLTAIKFQLMLLE